MPNIPFIDNTSLEAVLRRSSGRAAFQLREWQANPLGGNAGNPVSAGLYRITGTGWDAHESVVASVVLKVIQSPANVGWKNMGEGDDPTHWNYWKREAFIYRSDLLEKLPEGVFAPRCWGVEERPGQVIWLWLEDIRDSLDGVWTLERYALTARHLGRLNGMYALPAAAPAYPWLGVNLTGQWLSQMHPEGFPWEHPLVLKRYPKCNAFRRMLGDGERINAALASLPRTLCHGDTYPTNFMSRRTADGQEGTVALDWALANMAPVGDDLGQFTLGVQNQLKNHPPEEITNRLFESYLVGLREGGCQVDARLVQFGFCASAALRVGLFQVMMMNLAIEQGELSPVGDAEEGQELECFEIRMANEAYTLLESMELA